MNKLLTVMLLAAIGLAMASNTPVTPVVSSTQAAAAPSEMTTHGAASTNDAAWQAAFDKLQSDYRGLESRYVALEQNGRPVAQACGPGGCSPAVYRPNPTFARRGIFRGRR